ncbi:MAG TPA: UDP-glucose 4-epimerase GalE [Vicinamibacterales bacterium]|nr:UDP-glucose 4-epimerase GalE [Vicinamibacterales bacterium]
MPAVLVTGGAGYIGSHAVKALVRAGYRVVVYDDLSAGHRAAVEAVNARRAGAPVELVEGDIRETDAVRDALRRARCEAVLHFAARASVAESVRDPAGYYRTNVGGTLSVLEAMAAEGVARFVFSSTAAVFGEPVVTPIDEQHPKRPINSYGETKLAVERALPHFERACGLRWMALRYFNAAGADPDGDLGEDHDPETHLIPLALAAAAGGPPLQVFGDDYPTADGTCVRDFVHVTDLAEAHVLALRALEQGAASTAYNLGNGRPVSVREVIAAVERVTGRTVRWRLAPRRPGDPATLYAASNRIRRELDWRPGYEAIDAIVETAWRWRQGHPHGFGRRARG